MSDEECHSNQCLRRVWTVIPLALGQIYEGALCGGDHVAFERRFGLAVVSPLAFAVHCVLLLPRSQWRVRLPVLGDVTLEG